ncbi:AarF/UbiB family protein [Arthrobacter sp. HLT1-20]
MSRPGVVVHVQEDLEILQNLAHQASRNWVAVADYSLEASATEFAITLRAELDYLQGGCYAERFASNFANHPSIHVPRIFWSTTTSRLLTIERIFGLKIDDGDVLAMPAFERTRLADVAAKAAIKMIVEAGFFPCRFPPGETSAGIQR